MFRALIDYRRAHWVVDETALHASSSPRRLRAQTKMCYLGFLWFKSIRPSIGSRPPLYLPAHSSVRPSICPPARPSVRPALQPASCHSFHLALAPAHPWTGKRRRWCSRSERGPAAATLRRSAFGADRFLKRLDGQPDAQIDRMLRCSLLAGAKTAELLNDMLSEA